MFQNQAPEEYGEYQQPSEATAANEITAEPTQYQLDPNNQYQQDPQYDANYAYDANQTNTVADDTGLGEYNYADPAADPKVLLDTEYSQYEQEYVNQSDQQYNAEEQYQDPQYAEGTNMEAYSADQYYAQQQPEDPNSYYEGQTQPGEQYYAEQPQADSYDQQPSDNAYYNQYENPDAQPTQSVEDYYAANPQSEVPVNLNDDNSLSQQNLEYGLNGEMVTQPSQDMPPTDYLASETDISSAHESVAQDAAGPPGVGGDRSESDFDFSAK